MEQKQTTDSENSPEISTTSSKQSNDSLLNSYSKLHYEFQKFKDETTLRLNTIESTIKIEENILPRPDTVCSNPKTTKTRPDIINSDIRFINQQTSLNTQENTHINDQSTIYRPVVSISRRLSSNDYIDRCTQTSNFEETLLSTIDTKLENIKDTVSDRMAKLERRLDSKYCQACYDYNKARSTIASNEIVRTTMTLNQTTSNDLSRELSKYHLDNRRSYQQPENLNLQNLRTGTDFLEPWSNVITRINLPTNVNTGYDNLRNVIKNNERKESLSELSTKCIYSASNRGLPKMSPSNRGLPKMSESSDIQIYRERYTEHLISEQFKYDQTRTLRLTENNTNLQIIRRSVFLKYPLSEIENEEEIWQLICFKLNSKLHQQPRIQKRKLDDRYDLINIENLRQRENYEINKVLKPNFEENYETIARLPSDERDETFALQAQESSRLSMTASPQFPFHIRNDTPNVVSSPDYSSPDSTEELATFFTSKIPKKKQRLEKEKSTSSVTNTSDTEDSVGSSPKSNIISEASTRVEISSCEEVTSTITYENTTLKDSKVIKVEEGVSEEEKNTQYNREDLTRSLIESMFTRYTLATSNVTGARGKFMLDPVKMAKVREVVFTNYPAKSLEEEEPIWRILTNKINTKCRGVKRLMKRNGLLKTTNDFKNIQWHTNTSSHNVYMNPTRNIPIYSASNTYPDLRSVITSSPSNSQRRNSSVGSNEDTNVSPQTTIFMPSY